MLKQKCDDITESRVMSKDPELKTTPEHIYRFKQPR
jgi:hypothetical protein